MKLSKARIAQLLSTNDAPTLSEVEAIQDICDEQALVAADLLRQLAEMGRNMAPLRYGVLSPLRRMPPEVLGQIIFWALDNTGDDYGRQDLMDLCLVCKSWRDAARLVHPLWANLRLATGGYPDKELTLKNIHTWFGRSGNQKRSLDINQWAWWGEESWLAEELAGFMADGPSLDNFSLSLGRVSHFETVLQSLLAPRLQDAQYLLPPWSTLTSLTLNFMECRWEKVPSLLNLPPNVRSFTLYLPDFVRVIQGSPEAQELLDISPDFLANLTCFRILTDWPWPRVANLFAGLTNLEELYFNFSHNKAFLSDWMGVAAKTVAMPMLKRIVCTHATFQAVKLLNILDTPRLQHVDLSFFHGPYTAYALSTHALESNWVPWASGNSQLETLAIRDVALENMAVVKLLATPLPSLTSLTLDNVAFDIETLDCLESRNQDTQDPYFPLLTTLELLQLDAEAISSTDILNFFSARMEENKFEEPLGPPITLKDLKITFKEKTLEETKELEGIGKDALDKLREGGKLVVDVGPRLVLRDVFAYRPYP